MRHVTLLVDGIPVRPVLYADRFVDRLRGLVGMPPTTAMIIPGRSVHGCGLRRSLWAVGVGGNGLVRSVTRLRPFGLRVDPGARWLLELPWEDRPPPPGSRVAFLLGCRGCPDG